MVRVQPLQSQIDIVVTYELTLLIFNTVWVVRATRVRVGVQVLKFAIKYRGDEMKKSCAYCGKIHDKKLICKAKYKSLTKTRDTKADKFRSSSAWQCKRLEIKQRDLFLCQICMHSVGLDINPYASRNISVHHIIRLQQDFDKRLNNDNLITLCEYHYKLQVISYRKR